MYLKYLTVSNFKNIEQVDIDCSPVLNCFVGNNGEGKTNLLDGIYYLSMCKSKFVSSDYASIRDNEDYFMLKATYSKTASFSDENLVKENLADENNVEENNVDENLEENISDTNISDENISNINASAEDACVSCGIKRSGKKSFKYNSKEYKKLSEHIGVIPLVFITPSDTSLITDGSEERRKFLNAVISQTDKQYLDALLRYNNVLMNRNKLLKNKVSEIDFSLIETMNEQMARYGKIIHDRRKSMISTFLPVFQQIYNAVSGEKELIGLQYRSDLDKGDLKLLLDENLERDCFLQHTSAGIHRDDLTLELNGRSLKNSGSQGQQKTFIVAMKMAQFRLIKQNSGMSPILLLDDIFDKLDTERVERLIAFVTGSGFGQIFLTDSNKTRLDKLLQKTATDYKLFGVSAGNVELIQASNA